MKAYRAIQSIHGLHCVIFIYGVTQACLKPTECSVKGWDAVSGVDALGQGFEGYMSHAGAILLTL